MYDDALNRFTSALQTGGFNSLIAYNAALCHYRRRENVQALHFIGKFSEIFQYSGFPRIWNISSH